MQSRKLCKTIHAALDAGITLFNTGEFYNASESELIAAAKELGVKVLAFGTVGHGLLQDTILHVAITPRLSYGLLSPEHRENNLGMIRKVKEIADEKGVTLRGGWWYCCIITSTVNLDENPLGY